MVCIRENKNRSCGVRGAQSACIFAEA